MCTKGRAQAAHEHKPQAYAEAWRRGMGILTIMLWMCWFSSGLILPCAFSTCVQGEVACSHSIIIIN